MCFLGAVGGSSRGCAGFTNFADFAGYVVMDDGMSDWVMPPELGQPLPRIVKRKRFIVPAFAFLFGIFLLIALFTLVTSAELYFKDEALKERGVVTDGTVTKLYVTTHKGGTRDHVVYSYETSPKTTFSAEDLASYRIFNELHVGDTVPIVYDRDYPPRSALNFNNIVLTRNNASVFFIGLAIVIPISMILLVMPLLLLRQYRLEMHLLKWGQVTAATILSDTEYDAGRAGRASAVTYRFTDESGHTVRGKRAGLPVRGSRKGAMYVEMFGDPTVIYDPVDSSKNQLYPFMLVDCVSKSSPSVFSAP
jgi:hypothetical protein